MEHEAGRYHLAGGQVQEQAELDRGPKGEDKLAGRRDLLRRGHAPSGEPAGDLGAGKVGGGLTLENFPSLDP